MTSYWSYYPRHIRRVMYGAGPTILVFLELSIHSDFMSHHMSPHARLSLQPILDHAAHWCIIPTEHELSKS
jgi:hypothetical protein